jgi:hypothetical protein
VLCRGAGWAGSQFTVHSYASLGAAGEGPAAGGQDDGGWRMEARGREAGGLWSRQKK